MQRTVTTGADAAGQCIPRAAANSAPAGTGGTPECTHPRQLFLRLQAVQKLCKRYTKLAAVVAMARRANAPVPGLPELDAAVLARFYGIRRTLLLGEPVPDVNAELVDFFRATHAAMTRAQTPEVEAYARERVAALRERQDWLLGVRQASGVRSDTLLWQQTEHEIEGIRTELCEYRAYEASGCARARGGELRGRCAQE